MFLISRCIHISTLYGRLPLNMCLSSLGIPQSLLQLYIFLRITVFSTGSLQQSDRNRTDFGIEGYDLILSLGVSLLNLCVNYWQFRKAAKFHGYSVVYVVCGNQSGESIPNTFSLRTVQVIRTVGDSNGGSSDHEIRATISCH